ncbi:MiaB/RimO family radical SAM methylthiotransferase, partial [bacterium]|nr:MiaB/RimO family radical SAM methylthiotransferase [bacterium]
LKISEGCDNRCAYCAIPLIRGPLTSRPEAEIIAEARHLIKNGVRELIVIAQDTTNYGQDRGEPGAIVPLLRQLVKIEGLEWLRVMYSHPAHYSDEFIDLVASEDKICKYLDIPIQHISDSILSRMRRRITRSGIEALTKKVRDRIPGVALRTSLIVGFPGESDQEFQELLEYIAGAKFERLGAFVYSPEDGTPAYAWGDEIPLAVKQDRAEQVQMVQSDISQERNQKLVGTIQRVIVDEFDVDQGMFFGRTQWDAPEIDNVIWLKETDLEIGGFYQVKITEAFDFDLIGQVIRN